MVQGVIFPCMGNILGVILFLRGPWIVGKGGILEAFGVGLVCCTCTFLTTLSLSAIATNGKIAGGGAYYLISRSLGPALGAGVGLCFYMANSIGAAMYFMGCVEAWEIAQPQYQIGEIGDLNNVRMTGYVILVFAVVIIFGGIKYVSRLGTVFLMVVLFVILCMYVGCLMGPNDLRPASYIVDLVTADGSTVSRTLTWTGPSSSSFSDNWASAWDAPQGAFPKDTTQYSFVNMMGLYFPSVTGIMAGANRSADLMDPTSAIPKGTLFAQLSTSFIYLSFIFVFGSVAPRETLLNDKFFASTSAFPFKEIVIYGVMASSLGAGLNSLVSGTKLLSAIAGDGTLPILRIFRAAPGKEPRLALLASGALCALSITIGELNAIAPLLTMFFLMCYTCVNMSCTILHFVSDPNWRPTFRYHHWSISLIAAALCVWMMFAMAAVIAMAAILFCGLILAYAAYNSANTKWGDGFQGMKFQLAKNILISMDAKLHTKNWRPQLLVVTEPKMRPLSSSEGSALLFPDLGILKIASQLKNGRGFIVLGGICCAKGPGKLLSQGGLFLSEKMSDQVAESHYEVKELLRKYMIDGFGKIVYSEDFTTALTDLVQSSGLGAFEPNCVLASWPKDALELGRAGVETRTKLVNMVQISAIFQKVMILTKGQEWPEFDDRKNGTIDIWWIVGDGGVLLLLPCLLKKHRVWSGCRIRLFVLADRAGDDVDLMQRELDMYVRDFRLNVEVHIKVVDEVVEGGMSPRGASATGVQFGMEQPPDDTVPSEYTALEEGMLKGERKQDHLKVEHHDQPMRVTSGQSLTDTLKTWRGRQFQRERSFDSKVSGGSGENSKSMNSHTWSARHNLKQFPERLKEWNVPQDMLTMNSMTDPGPGAQAAGKAMPSVDQLHFGDDRQTSDRQIPAPNHANPLASDISGNFQRQVSANEGKRTLFLHDARQLSATAPCSPEELSVVSVLNKLILEESEESDLVCTNLPVVKYGMLFNVTLKKKKWRSLMLAPWSFAVVVVHQSLGLGAADTVRRSFASLFIGHDCQHEEGDPRQRRDSGSEKNMRNGLIGPNGAVKRCEQCGKVTAAPVAALLCFKKAARPKGACRSLWLPSTAARRRSAAFALRVGEEDWAFVPFAVRTSFALPDLLGRTPPDIGREPRDAVDVPVDPGLWVPSFQAPGVLAASAATASVLKAAARRLRAVAAPLEAPPAPVAPPEEGNKGADESLAAKVRGDFPALSTEAYPGVPLIYLDSGATSQKPTCVLRALTEYYEHSANVHRGAYALAERATEAFEHARSSVATLIGAGSAQEIVFTSGATDAINLVAESWGSQNLGPGDEVLITVMEHHSNIVPWQLATQRTGATLKYVGITEEGTLDMEEFHRLLSPQTKMVAFVHISNTLGCINPVKEIAEAAHAVGSKVLLDACQSVPHLKIDVQDLGIDFLVASSHKMYGPTGVGFLWGRPEILEAMPPWKGGGEMIKEVHMDMSFYADVPARFEAGTPPIAQAVGLGVACDYLLELGMDKVEAYEQSLARYLWESLSAVPGLRLYGPPASAGRAALVAFNDTEPDIYPQDVAGVLDVDGVAIRAGHHCAQPLHRALEATYGSARVSCAFYNTKQEIDKFVKSLTEALETVRAGEGCVFDPDDPESCNCSSGRMRS
ncbi:SLC12A5 [Symbiodinium pilosum]|uniref:cysteine desulfurase n=1 Tax=Symbiodinium pilosum TaxID=2952 RepID=A0A812TZP6_SYMPI|nr:SLC12A5 [Symbiodinium pilosum]